MTCRCSGVRPSLAASTSRSIFPAMARPVSCPFSVSVRGVGETAALLGVLFLLALLWNLLRLGRSPPIELLHSDSAGERETKTKRLL